MTDQQERRMAEPGQYVAKPLDYGITTTKDNKPQVCVLFGFTDSHGVNHQMYWFGSLNAGKAREITMKALAVLGFQMGVEQLGEIAKGIDGGALNTSRNVSVTVTEEADNNGAARHRISWVNSLGGKILEKRLSFDQAASLLGPITGSAASFADQEVPF